MSQELPDTSFALLGLLTFGDEELTGYELKQRADITMRFYWVAPAMSQIYSELSRLSEHGLIRPSGSGRGKKYAITPAGRRALRSWMDTGQPGFPVWKHPIALRLMNGHLTDLDSTLAMLSGYEEELGAAHADLTGVRESLRGGDAAGETFRFPSLVAEWGLAHFESELRIVAQLRSALEEESDLPQ